MSGWTLLICGAVSGFGALVFLAIVAHGVDGVEQSVRRQEDAERRAQKLRQAAAEGDATASTEAVRVR